MAHFFLINVIADRYSMRCELFAYSEDYCLMTSPQNVPNATAPSPACMMVRYEVSSDDVVIKVDISVAGDSVKRTTLQKATHVAEKYIQLTDLASMYFTVSFRAERATTSVNRPQYAVVTGVWLGACNDSGQ